MFGRASRVDLHRDLRRDRRGPTTALLAKWTRIREIRDAVNKEIEALRAAGKVGSSLQAERGARPRRRDDHALLASLGDDLKFVFITSAVDAGARATRSPSTVDAVARRQVRALLALPRRRRPRPGASRRSAAAAPATCSAPAKPRRSPDGARRTRRRRQLLPWLGLALVVLVARPVHQGADPRRLPARRRHHVTRSSTSCGRTTPAPRSPSWPARPAGSAGSSSASASAAAVFIVWMLRTPRRAEAVLLGAGLHPRRRGRQRGRPAAARLRGRLPPVPLGAAGTSRRSTSPTARSPSAPRCLILDELLRVRRSGLTLARGAQEAASARRTPASSRSPSLPARLEARRPCPSRRSRAT